MAVANYKTEDPIKAGTENVSSTALLQEINKIEEEDGGKSLEDIGAAFSEVSDQDVYDRYATSTETRLGSDFRNKQRQDAAKNDLLFGYDFNYEYVGDARLEQDNKELQGQRQPGWDKFKRGTARLVGETLLNVLEIPGAFGGVATAAVTGDVTDMTNNWYLNFFEGLKDKLHEETPIYKTEADKNAGVLETLVNGSWWATEGVSGLAFFLSALVPGGVATKAGKATQFMAKLASKGKTASKIVSKLDDFAIKTGAASATSVEAAAAGTGAAAAEFGNLFNATLLNTAFESVVEARGAMESYEASALDKYNSGEINRKEYENILANKGTVANRTFWMNNALLLGPNFLMSKALLGKGSSSWKQVLDKVGVDDAGRFGLKKVINKANQKKFKDLNFLDKGKHIAASAPVSAVKEAGKVVAKNTFREGVIEEMGQMAIENYWSHGYLDEQIYGERNKDIVQTYSDVFNSKEGQVAALFGGILGTGGHAVGALKGRKSFNKRVEGTIAELNTARDLFSVARLDFNKYDENGNVETKTDENGVEIPVIDKTKVGELAAARTEFENMQEVVNYFNENGDTKRAKIMEAKIQAMSFIPFLGKGKEGMEALQATLEANPNLEAFVASQNEKEGTSHTKESFINEQMEKARSLEQDYLFHTKEILKPLFSQDYKDLGVTNKEDKAIASSLRTRFNQTDSGNYTNTKAALREVEEQIDSKNRAKSKLTAKTSQQVDKDLKELGKVKKELEDSIVELEGEQEVEARWKKFYANAMHAKKYNDKELTGYLDELVGSLQKAKTIAEVDTIIEKAKSDGIFYSQVKAENLPKEVKSMAESTNIKDVIAAIKIYEEHREIEGGDLAYFGLIEDAKMQLDSITENLHDILVDLENSRVEIKDEYDKQYKIYSDYVDEYNSVVALIEEADIVFNELNKSNKKSAAFRKAYSEHVKAKKKLEELSFHLMKSTETAEINVNKLRSRLNGLDLVKEMAEKLPSLKGKGDLSLKINQVDAQIFHTITQKLIGDKEAILKSHSEISDLITNKFRLDELEVRANHFRALNMKVQSLLAGVEKAIKKYKKYAKNKANLEVIAELEQEYELLLERAEQGAIEANEAEDAYLKAKGIADANALKAFIAITDMLTLIDDLRLGKNLMETKEYEEFVSRYTEAPSPPPTPPAPPAPPKKPTKDEGGFVNLTDPTSGEGLARIEDTHLKISFEKIFGNKEQLEEFFHNVIEHADDAGIVPVELMVRYHPYLKNSANYQAFADFHGLPDTNIDKLVDEAIDKYTAKPVDPNIKKQADVVEQSEKSVNNAKEALNKDKTNNNLSFVKKNYNKAVALVTDLAKKVETFKDTPIANKLKNLLQEARTVAIGYKGRIKELTPDPSTAPSSAIETIKGSPELKQYVKDLLEAKTAEIKKAQLEKVRKQAQGESALWRASHNEEDYLSPGNKVYWENKDGSRSEGKAHQFLKSTKSGSNVIVETPTGELLLISSMHLNKVKTTANNLNSENFDDYSKEWNATEGRKVKTAVKNGTYTAVKLSTRNFGGRTRKVVNSDNIAVLDEKGNVQYEISAKSEKKWKDYLEEPRDKTKDLFKFQLAADDLKQRIFHKTASKEEAAAYYAFKKRQAGKMLNSSEINLLIEYMPISVRYIAPNEGLHNFAGTRLLTAKEGGKLGYLEESVRNNIFSLWNQGEQILEGKKKNVLSGVYANPITQAPGTLNTRDNTRTKLSEMKGHDINKLELFTPRRENNGSTAAYDINGKIVTKGLPNRVLRNTGRTFMKMKTNTGAEFFLALQNARLRDFNGGKELGFVMSIIDSILLDNKNFKDEIDNDLRSAIEKESPALYKALQSEIAKKHGDIITYGMVYNTLIFEGIDTNQLTVSISAGARKSIRIGDTTWNSQEYSANKDTIKKTLGIKFINVGFGGHGLKVGNKDYLNYIIENGALTSSIPKGEAAFATVPDKTDDRFEKGLEVFIKPESIKFSKEAVKAIVPEKGKPADSEQGTTIKKKVALSSSARDWIRLVLAKEGVKLGIRQIKNLSNDTIIMINDLHKDYLADRQLDIKDRVNAIKNKC